MEERLFARTFRAREIECSLPSLYFSGLNPGPKKLHIPQTIEQEKLWLYCYGKFDYFHYTIAISKIAKLL